MVLDRRRANAIYQRPLSPGCRSSFASCQSGGIWGVRHHARFQAYLPRTCTPIVVLKPCTSAWWPAEAAGHNTKAGPSEPRSVGVESWLKRVRQDQFPSLLSTYSYILRRSLSSKLASVRLTYRHSCPSYILLTIVTLVIHKSIYIEH